MTAKEMFEELDYTIMENSDDWLSYIDKDLDEVIVFFHKDRTFEKFILNEKYRDGVQVCGICLKELKAINKQVEELGW